MQFMKNLFLFVFFCLFLLFFNCYTTKQINNNIDDYFYNWPSFRGNLYNSGMVQKGPIPPLALDWIYPLKFDQVVVRSSMASFENRLYFADWGGNIWCFDQTSGLPFWNINLDAVISSSPAVDKNILYLTACDSYFYAIDIKNKKIKWTFKMDNISISSPQYDDHNVYFGSNDTYLYALDKHNGRLKWKIKTDYFIASSPCFYNQNIFISTNGGSIYCINKQSGQVVWDEDIGNSTFASPVYSDLCIYIGDDNGNFYALNAQNGEIKWSYKLPEIKKEIWVDHSLPNFVLNSIEDIKPVINTASVSDKYIICVSMNGIIVCLDKFGNENWTYEIGEEVNSTPLIFGDYAYLTTKRGYIYAFDIFNGDKVWEYKVRGRTFASPIVCGKSICFSTEFGYIYSFSNQ